MSIQRKYSVWVGGTEVNNHLLPLDEAIELAHECSERGYSDVQLSKNQ